MFCSVLSLIHFRIRLLRSGLVRDSAHSLIGGEVAVTLLRPARPWAVPSAQAAMQVAPSLLRGEVEVASWGGQKSRFRIHSSTATALNLRSENRNRYGKPKTMLKC